MFEYYLGIGTNKGFNGQGSFEFINNILQQHNIYKLKALASLRKTVMPTYLYELEKLFHAPLYLFSKNELEIQTPRLKNPSVKVFEAVGCHGVAEAAALSIAGALGELIVEKTCFSNMTIAISKVILK